MNEQAPLNDPFNPPANTLSVSAFSTAGVKAINQDAYAFYVSDNPNQSSVFVIADGVSSSTVSQVASDFATRQFIKLFNMAPEQWSVKTRAETIIKEINALLYTRTQRSPFCYTPEKGYVCTFTVAVVTGNRVDVFHVGDCQIQVLSKNAQSPILLTKPHRQVSESEPSQSYLTKALGVQANIDIDHTTLTLNSSSTLSISSDGVYEFVSLPTILKKINEAETLPENQAALVLHEAFSRGSDDNLTLLLVKVLVASSDGLSVHRHPPYTGVSTSPHSSVLNRPLGDQLIPNSEVSDAVVNYSNQQSDLQVCEEPATANLSTGDEIDGLKLERQLYTSARSHVFIATNSSCEAIHTYSPVVVKTPATDFALSPEMLNGFLIESWFARRINSSHVIKSPTFTDLGLPYSPSAFYSVSEYVQGQTLAQWAVDNPTAPLEQVRNII